MFHAAQKYIQMFINMVRILVSRLVDIGLLCLKSLPKFLTLQRIGEVVVVYGGIFAIVSAYLHVWPGGNLSDPLTIEVKTPRAAIDLGKFTDIYHEQSGLEWYQHSPQVDSLLHRFKDGKIDYVLVPLGEIEVPPEYQKEGLPIEEYPSTKFAMLQAKQLMSPREEKVPNENEIGAMISLMYARKKAGMSRCWLLWSNPFESLLSKFSVASQKAPFMLAYAHSRTVYTPVIIRNNSDHAAFNVKITVDQAHYPGLQIADRYRNEVDGFIPMILPKGLRLFYLEAGAKSVNSKHIRVVEDQRIEFNRAKIRKAMWMALALTSLLVLFRIFCFCRYST